jgi:hypothetical protein
MYRPPPLPLSEVNPFEGGMYSDAEGEYYSSWPEVAQDLLDRTSRVISNLLNIVHGLDGEAATRLTDLVQNLMIGRFAELEQFPALVELATGLPGDKSHKVAAIITEAVLIPFNAALQCWEENLRDLQSKWDRGHS